MTNGKALRVLHTGGHLLLLVIALGLLVPAAACRSSQQSQQPATKEVIVTAPVSGIIHAVLVNEDAAVNEGASILQITVKPEGANGQQKSEATKREQRNEQKSAEADLAVAEAEVTRAADKLNRIKPLVARGYASRADLDAAAASHQDALARVQRARDNSGALQERAAAATPGAPPEKMISVVAPVAGKVRIIAAQTGQHVVAGQQLFALVSST